MQYLNVDRRLFVLASGDYFWSFQINLHSLLLLSAGTHGWIQPDWRASLDSEPTGRSGNVDGKLGGCLLHPKGQLSPCVQPQLPSFPLDNVCNPRSCSHGAPGALYLSHASLLFLLFSIRWQQTSKSSGLSSGLQPAGAKADALREEMEEAANRVEICRVPPTSLLLFTGTNGEGWH